MYTIQYFGKFFLKHKLKIQIAGLPLHTVYTLHSNIVSLILLCVLNDCLLLLVWITVSPSILVGLQHHF